MENGSNEEENTDDKQNTDEDTYAEYFLNRHGQCEPCVAIRAYELFLFSDLNEHVKSHFRTLKIKLPEYK